MHIKVEDIASTFFHHHLQHQVLFLQPFEAKPHHKHTTNIISTMVQNKSAVFLKYPTEYPVAGEHIEIQSKELTVALKDNDVLLRNLYFSLDPCMPSFLYLSLTSATALQQPNTIVLTISFLSFFIDMRGRMRDAKSYVPGFQVGEAMSGYGISEVFDSKNAAFPVGAIVSGVTGWQEYSVIPGATGLRVLPGARDSPIPLSAHLGILGVPVSFPSIFFGQKKKIAFFKMIDY
jgi:NADPH-dependent curcumin reductase CurA